MSTFGLFLPASYKLASDQKSVITAHDYNNYTMQFVNC